MILAQVADALALIPLPGTDLVPDGWADSTVVPWLAEQHATAGLPEADAQLAGLEAALKTIGADAFEITKARRYLEVRWGELLGPGGGRGGDRRSDDQSHASDRSNMLTKNDRHRFRQLAAAKTRVLTAIRSATDADELSRAAIMRRTNDGVFTSDHDEWATPQDLFDQLNGEFGFGLDVCALPSSAKCERYFSPQDDGLAQDWTGACFMNPPYGDAIGNWVRKAHESAAGGATVVCLVPARVDTAWWWDHCRYGEIRFLRGRLKFGGSTNSAPFPSAVVIFGREARVVWWER